MRPKRVADAPKTCRGCAQNVSRMRPKTCLFVHQNPQNPPISAISVPSGSAKEFRSGVTNSGRRPGGLEAARRRRHSGPLSPTAMAGTQTPVEPSGKMASSPRSIGSERPLGQISQYKTEQRPDRPQVGRGHAFCLDSRSAGVSEGALLRPVSPAADRRLSAPAADFAKNADGTLTETPVAGAVDPVSSAGRSAFGIAVRKAACRAWGRPHSSSAVRAT